MMFVCTRMLASLPRWEAHVRFICRTGDIPARRSQVAFRKTRKQSGISQGAAKEQPRRQGGQGAARADQEQPEATSGQPGAAKGSWEQPGAAKSSQGQPGTAKGSQKHPGAARKSQIICVFIVLNSNRTSKVLNHMCFHSSEFKPYF